MDDWFRSPLPPFILAIRDARRGNTLCEIRVPTTASTVNELIDFVRRERHVPPEALRVHVAHNGALLEANSLLEPLRESPVVVLAIVMPPPPRTIFGWQPAAAQPQPPPPVQQPPPPPPAPQQGFHLPSRAEIAAAWERAFPPPATQPTIPDEPEERVCRVCFCGEEEGPLLAPCRCRGSMKYVHARCLNEWRVSSANPRSFTRCDQCGYTYRTQQTALGKYLEDPRLHIAATILTLFLLLLIGILLPFHPERLLYHLLRFHPAWYYSWWSETCDAAVRGLALPASLGMLLSIKDAYTRHRGLPFEQQTWAAALILSVAGDGLLVARPLLAGGLVYFTCHLAKEVQGLSRRLFTRFGERVLDLNLEEVAR